MAKSRIKITRGENIKYKQNALFFGRLGKRKFSVLCDCMTKTEQKTKEIEAKKQEIVFFNSLSKKKEKFEPLSKGIVKLYTCGPTVYDYAHIGNFRAYVFEDILRRYLEWKGYEVKHVMNFTDVDDKTIRRSRELNLDLKEFTEIYTKTFLEDIDIMGIKRANLYCKATEHIPEMVNLIKKLIKNKLAYKGEDCSYYFRISAFPNYGKLTGLEKTKLKAGGSGRVKADEYEKENIADFALWKAWSEEDGNVYWDTELGRGRPGWHIECSAMSMKYLGETFDIHTGGIDNRFPHHENEIAQSTGATGKLFAKYFLHCDHLLVNNEKMSKSKGNYYTLRDILKKGYSPQAIRYLLLSAPYRSSLNFTFEGLKSAENTLKRIQEITSKLKSIIKNGKTTNTCAANNVANLANEAKNEFDKGMADDLNTPIALAALHTFIRKINTLMDNNEIDTFNARIALDFLENIDTILNVSKKKEEEKISEEMQQLLREREEARKNKDWKKADELRKKIQEKGFEVNDTPNGPKISKIE